MRAVPCPWDVQSMHRLSCAIKALVQLECFSCPTLYFSYLLAYCLAYQSKARFTLILSKSKNMLLTVRLLSFKGMWVIRGRVEGRYKNKEGLSPFIENWLELSEDRCSLLFFWTLKSLDPGNKLWCYRLSLCLNLVGCCHGINNPLLRTGTLGGWL